MKRGSAYQARTAYRMPLILVAQVAMAVVFLSSPLLPAPAALAPPVKNLAPGSLSGRSTVQYWPLPHYKQRFDPNWKRYYWECPGDPDLSYTRQPHYDQRLKPDWSTSDWLYSGKAHDPGWHHPEPDGNI